jgi:hypothetical protein
LVGVTAEQLEFRWVDLRVASKAVAMADWMAFHLVVHWVLPWVDWLAALRVAMKAGHWVASLGLKMVGQKDLMWAARSVVRKGQRWAVRKVVNWALLSVALMVVRKEACLAEQWDRSTAVQKAVPWERNSWDRLWAGEFLRQKWVRTKVAPRVETTVASMELSMVDWSANWKAG